MSTLNRLRKELEEIHNNPPTNCSAGVIEDDIYNIYNFFKKSYMPIDKKHYFNNSKKLLRII